MQLLHSKDFSAGSISPRIAALLESIKEEDLREWVQTISVPRHFTHEAEANKKAGEWIASMFRHWGYEVQRQGKSGNVIATFGEPRGPIVLVGAHFDSVPECPGADDNGSAVAAMLACAAACQLWRPAPEVLFVAFNREEDGFVGSREFVEEYFPRQKLSIRCAHILEMVGFASHLPGSQRVPAGLPIQLPERGDFLGLLANGDSSNEMNHILTTASTYTTNLPVSGLEVIPGAELVFPVLARSDHVPFWMEEIPAVMWTDTAEFRNPNYHKGSDSPETLNYTFLRRVAQLLTANVIASCSKE